MLPTSTSIAQWCLPSRRQQAGSCESSGGGRECWRDQRKAEERLPAGLRKRVACLKKSKIRSREKAPAGCETPILLRGRVVLLHDRPDVVLLGDVQREVVRGRLRGILVRRIGERVLILQQDREDFVLGLFRLVSLAFHHVATGGIAQVLERSPCHRCVGPSTGVCPPPPPRRPPPPPPPG